LTQTFSSHEGVVGFRGHSVWYRIVGDGETPGKLPLLCLHGGPGVPHDYLQPMQGMAGTGRRVVFYDQIGCGNSSIRNGGDRPEWTVELFVDEVDAVRRTLGLDRVHIFGNSWGGMLGMEYALTHPHGLASLVIESSPASLHRWVSEANRLRAELPADVQDTLKKHEDAGTTDDPEYEEAMMVFYRRHVCRLDPWPDYVVRAFDKLSDNPEVYYTMNGPSEFHVVGTIKDWDIEHRLGEIRVPTLITSGRHDEATPELVKVVHDGIPNSEWVIFENSSHMAHAEETQDYLQVVDDFLSRVEAGLSPGTARP
jgi:L-proline amide hydrolase